MTREEAIALFTSGSLFFSVQYGKDWNDVDFHDFDCEALIRSAAKETGSPQSLHARRFRKLYAGLQGDPYGQVPIDDLFPAHRPSRSSESRPARVQDRCVPEGRPRPDRGANRLIERDANESKVGIATESPTAPGSVRTSLTKASGSTDATLGDIVRFLRQGEVHRSIRVTRQAQRYGVVKLFGDDETTPVLAFLEERIQASRARARSGTDAAHRSRAMGALRAYADSVGGEFATALREVETRLRLPHGPRLRESPPLTSHDGLGL